jgi:hypothetical protein
MEFKDIICGDMNPIELDQNKIQAHTSAVTFLSYNKKCIILLKKFGLKKEDLVTRNYHYGRIISR